MVMGPTCGMVLADLGRRGDQGRADRRRQHAHAARLGRGLLPAVQPQQEEHRARPASSREGVEAALRLIASADVVSENFKPGTMEKLGLGLRQRCRKLNPRLIYVSHKGFLPGPYDHRTALDEVVQMMGGLAYMTGRAGDPLRAGTSVNDIMGGMFGAIGAMAALAPARHTPARAGSAERAVREQCVPGRPAHDAVRRDGPAGRADAEPHLGLGGVRRVHRQGRRADLPGGRQRHAVGDVLRRIRLRRPARPTRA